MLAVELDGHVVSKLDQRLCVAFELALPNRWRHIEEQTPRREDHRRRFRSTRLARHLPRQLVETLSQPMPARWCGVFHNVRNPCLDRRGHRGHFSVAASSNIGATQRCAHSPGQRASPRITRSLQASGRDKLAWRIATSVARPKPGVRHRSSSGDNPSRGPRASRHRAARRAKVSVCRGFTRLGSQRTSSNAPRRERHFDVATAPLSRKALLRVAQIAYGYVSE